MATTGWQAQPLDGDRPSDPAGAAKEIRGLVRELEEEWHLDDRIAYMTRNPKSDPAAELTLAARPMAVIWIGACDGQPCRAWGDGIRVELCPAEPRRVRRALMSSPSWCVIGEVVDDRQVRDVVLEIRRTGSRARILMLGADDDFARCERWTRRGVQVYLAACSSPERIIQAMRHAEMEDTVVIDARFHRPLLELVDRFQPNEDLSARELEVLRLASRGLRTEDIAGELHLTGHTVNFHLSNVIAKLGVRGRTQAVVRALLLGLIAAVDA